MMGDNPDSASRELIPSCRLVRYLNTHSVIPVEVHPAPIVAHHTRGRHMTALPFTISDVLSVTAVFLPGCIRAPTPGPRPGTIPVHTMAPAKSRRARPGQIHAGGHELPVNGIASPGVNFPYANRYAILLSQSDDRRGMSSTRKKLVRRSTTPGLGRPNVRVGSRKRRDAAQRSTRGNPSGSGFFSLANDRITPRHSLFRGVSYDE
jgi:hypothetical protein